MSMGSVIAAFFAVFNLFLFALKGFLMPYKKVAALKMLR